MAQVKAQAADRLIAAPPAALKALLLYGPDHGLVRERAQTAVKAVAGDLSDPFRVAELSPGTVADDPARLLDEALQLAFTGGRRVVRLRQAGDGIAKALAALLDNSSSGALVVVEAEELAKGSALRTLCENHDAAAAIACYRDEGAGLGILAREEFGALGVSADADALGWLTDHLGNDREVTRSELRKLALYAGPGGRVDLDMAMQAVGDSAAMALDDLVFAVGDGDLATADRVLHRLLGEGLAPVALLRALIRHFSRLQSALALQASGQPPSAAMAALRPPVFFKQQERFRRQMGLWAEGRGGGQNERSRLDGALLRLLEAELAVKRTGAPDALLCARVALEVTRLGQR